MIGPEAVATTMAVAVLTTLPELGTRNQGDDGLTAFHWSFLARLAWLGVAEVAIEGLA